jgi:hypothetical protein
MLQQLLWSLEHPDGTTVARVYASDGQAALKLRPRTFKASDLTARRIVNIECSTPRLYRWLTGQATPYVARLTADGFVVLDEDRWATLLSAAEGHELPERK